MGENINKEVMKLVQQGCTYKEIQDTLKVSKGQIGRIIQQENPELWEIVKNPTKLQEFREKQSKIDINGETI